MNVLTGRSVVITGATGSFGHAFVKRLLDMDFGPARVCVLSRDEHKQAQMRMEFNDDSRLRWFLGDVRDLERLKTAFHGADVVVHGAAMKIVPACEYDFEECVKTNITGSQNVVKAAVACSVPRVIALSTDKACAAVTSYGGAKFMMERAIVNGNMIAPGLTRLSCTRYGNVMDSRGSVLPAWRAQVARGEPLTITDASATRFHMTQPEAVELVLLAANQMCGGEIFIPKLPAYRLGDLADAVSTTHPRVVTGLRVGEKKHESLISPDEMARDHETHYRVLPALHPWRNGGPDIGGEPLPEGFVYRSDTVRMLTPEELRGLP